MTVTERIKYGEEEDVQLGDDGPMLYVTRDSEQCPNCLAEQGEYHVPGCDIEQCPECEEQLISCSHVIMGEGYK